MNHDTIVMCLTVLLERDDVLGRWELNWRIQWMSEMRLFTPVHSSSPGAIAAIVACRVFSKDNVKVSYILYVSAIVMSTL